MRPLVRIPQRMRPSEVDVGRGKVAEEAGRAASWSGRGRRGRGRRGPEVEALAFGDGQRVGVTVPGPGFGGGAGSWRRRRRRGGGRGCLRCGRCPAGAGSRPQPRRIEEGADELLLGGGLVYGVEGCGVLEEGLGVGAEGFEVGGLGEGFLPGGGAEDAFFEKVAGEKLAGHWLRGLWGVGGVCGLVYPRGGCCASSGGWRVRGMSTREGRGKLAGR